MRLLIIEDSEFDRVLLRETFRDYPEIEEIKIVERLTDALPIVQDYDIVFLDLGLPDVTYPELLEWIKKCPIPVVVSSGRSDAKAVQECVEAGALQYIVKGSPAEQLMAGLTFALQSDKLAAVAREKRRAQCEKILELIERNRKERQEQALQDRLEGVLCE